MLRGHLLPPADERLVRHRLQLRRRPLRPGVGGAAVASTRRHGRSHQGLQHGLRRRVAARRPHPGVAAGGVGRAARATPASRWKFGIHGIDAGETTIEMSGGSTKYPDGQVVLLPRLFGHRDVALTSCPGEFAYPLLSGCGGTSSTPSMRSGPFDPLPGCSRARAGRPPSSPTAGRDPPGRAGGGGVARASHPGWPSPAASPAEPGGGYVVDLSGGLHPYGMARGSRPQLLAGVGHGPGHGARSGVISGWVLDAYGGVHPFGGAPRVRRARPGPAGGSPATSPPTAVAAGTCSTPGAASTASAACPAPPAAYWPGWDIARAIAMRPDGPGGYVLDASAGCAPSAARPGSSRPTTCGPTSTATSSSSAAGGATSSTPTAAPGPSGGAPALQHSLTWTA